MNASKYATGTNSAGTDLVSIRGKLDGIVKGRAPWANIGPNFPLTVCCAANINKSVRVQFA